MDTTDGRLEWVCEIIEGYASDLASVLNRLEAAGWRVVHVMPNGVNRWTATAARTATKD